MKIRQGFVSNSSSSSFYLRKPDKPLKYTEIPAYYSFNPYVSENARAWMQVIIWEALKPRETTEGEDSDYDYSPKDYLKDYVSDTHIAWMQSSDSLRKSEEYWEGAKKLADNPNGIVYFTIDGYDNEIFNGLRIPYSAASDIRDSSETIFQDSRYAIGYSD